MEALENYTHNLDGKSWEEAIVRAKANCTSPESLAYIYMAAPTNRETWNRLNDENEQVRTFYWKSVGWLTTGEWNADDYQHAVQQLISVRRSIDIAALLGFRPLSHEIIIQFLEATTVGRGGFTRLGEASESSRDCRFLQEA